MSWYQEKDRKYILIQSVKTYIMPTTFRKIKKLIKSYPIPLCDDGDIFAHFTYRKENKFRFR